MSHRRAAKNAEIKGFLFSVERTENKKNALSRLPFKDVLYLYLDSLVFKLSPLTTI